MIGERAERRPAAVVHQDVQSAEALHRDRHQMPGGAGVGNVGRHPDDLGAVRRGDLPRGAVDLLLVPG